MTTHNQVEIISIGTELLVGELTDTNARFLAAELRLIGIEVGRTTTAGDDREQLTAVIREALTRTDLLLATGGLGPTEDDLTRECLAEALGESLTLDTGLEQELRDYYARFGRGHMPSHNVRQAMLIPSAKAIPNPNGTAPGWWVEKEGKTIVLMPGPPREMEPMWHNEIKPRLLAKFPGKVALTRTLKAFGMGEATVNELVAPFFRLNNPSLGIYAKTDGIYLRLIARGDNAAELIEKVEKQIRDILKDHVWGTDEETLPDIVVKLLLARGMTLATFDSGTGGLISNMLTSVDGASGCYYGGLVAGTDKLKVSFGVSPDLLSQHGSISTEVAEAMAITIREKFAVDIGLGITGITGMDAPGDPTGIAYIGLADARGKTNWRQIIIPRRDLARHQLALAVLFRLRQRLMGI